MDQPTVMAAGRGVAACRRERGIALIMVLGVLAVVGLMASHVAIMSEVTAREAKVSEIRGQLRYAGESAADRAFWLLLADRAKYGANRALGRKSQEREDTSEEEWKMDGRVHQVEVTDADVDLAVFDADAGLDLNGPDAANRLRSVITLRLQEGQRQAEGGDQEALDRFLDVLSDYIDADDFVGLHGKEKADYEADGIPCLPRNGPLQFREEVYWLDGFAEALGAAGLPFRPREDGGGVIQIVPPPGLATRQGGQGPGAIAAGGRRPSFFAGPPEIIRYLANLTDIELERVLAARERWQKQGEPLDENLEPATLAKLQAVFSFDESGVATFWVTAHSANGEIVRHLRFTRDCRPGPGAFADPQAERLAYWEKVVF